MYNSLSHQGNTKQNSIKIPPYPSHNAFHQENMEMLARMWGENESLCTNDKNV
jgi:hypothetical protein